MSVTEEVQASRRLQLHHLRWSVLALYVGLTLLWTNRLGAQSGRTGRALVDAIGRVPINREIIAGWIVGLLVISVIGRPWRQVPTILGSWAPFLLSLYLYDFARSVGYRLERPVIVTPQLEIDKLLGLGTLPSEWLQRHLFDPDHIRWYDVATSAVYMTHFIVPYVTAGILWKVGTRIWRWYAASFVALNFSACAVFAAFATAPPWYAARQGLIGEFPRVIAGRGWSRIGLRFVTNTINKGQETVNPFAAIPSLHTAQASLVACFFAMMVPRRWRRVAWPLLALYPLAMGFVLVYSGEHYVIDVLVGWGFVATILTAGWWYRQRTGRTSPFTDRRAAFAGRHSLIPPRAVRRPVRIGQQPTSGHGTADRSGDGGDGEHPHDIEVGVGAGQAVGA
jgi:membrane-associated phospholipid phosphatase